MTGELLLIIGAGLIFLWGIANLIQTASVLKGFGRISQDNKNIILMEWIKEGIGLLFIGILVAMVTIIDPQTFIARAVYHAAAVVLQVLAFFSIFTGFKVKFIPF